MQNKTNQGQKVVPPILNREQGRGLKVFAAQLYADFLWVPPLLLRPLIPREEDEREWVRARFSERWLERASTIFFKFW